MQRKRLLHLILILTVVTILHLVFIRVFRQQSSHARLVRPPVTLQHFTPRGKSGIPPFTPAIVKSVPNASSSTGGVHRLLEARAKDYRTFSELCDGLFHNKASVQREAQQFQLYEDNALRRGKLASIKLSEELKDDCQSFLSRRNYWEFSPTKEEEDFPIAFSLLVYRDAVQVESLLRAIYVPHNFYCIHVDGKAPQYMHEAMAGLARCLQNVYVVPSPLRVYWGGIDLVYAELMCARLLLERSTKWKYYINLTGQEYPLWPNRQLVRILKAFAGANDITASTKNVFHERYLFSWKNGRNTHKTKSPPPGDLKIIRGTAHAIANRNFMHNIVHEPLAIDFLEWLGDTFVPDEMFLPTLNHNVKVFNVSGGNPENIRLFDPRRRGSVARFKEWFASSEQARRFGCRGFLQRGICVQGNKDLWKFVRAKQLFVNKVMMYRDPYAFKCLEYLHHQRTVMAYGQEEFNFDTTYYENLPFVRHHNR